MEVIMETEMHKKMYAILCYAASEALDALESPENTGKAKEILQNALWQAEELYITAEESD